MTALSFLCHLQKSLSRVTQELRQLSEKLKEETEQKEQLRRLKNEMENERWHLDKTIEKLQKEVKEREQGRDPASSEGLMRTVEACSCMQARICSPLTQLFVLAENPSYKETGLENASTLWTLGPAPLNNYLKKPGM